MVFCQAFIDDSATDRLDKRLFFAGYLMTAEQWRAFSNLWSAELKSGREIDYLRMAEANNLRGQFRGWSEAEKDRKLESLARIIAIFQPVSFEVSVSRVECAEIVTPISPRGLGRPHFSCAFLTMSTVGQYASRMRGQLSIGFVFDEQDGVDNDVDMFFPVLHQSLPPKVRRCINGKPEFGDDKKVLPLQAADMLAWHIRRDYEAGGERWAHPMLKYLMSGDVHIANSLNRSLMDQWAKDSASLPGIESLRSKGEWRRAKLAISALSAESNKQPLRMRVKTAGLVWKIKLRRLLRK